MFNLTLKNNLSFAFKKDNYFCREITKKLHISDSNNSRAIFGKIIICIILYSQTNFFDGY